MIKQLTKIGNSQGVILDKSILELLNIKDIYADVSKRHRKSLDKLGR
jgi:antitoxin component of MazEF toxin-antitoxin module